MIVPPGGNQFDQPKPDAGMFLGTLIDVADLGFVTPKNPNFPGPPVHRIKLVWVLDKKDKDGKPFIVTQVPPLKMVDGGKGSKKSRLYEIWEGVLGTAPAVPYETEDLIGHSNLLYLAKEGDYVVIKGFMPVPSGQVPPKAPVDFVRDKDDPKRQAARAAKKQTQTTTTAPVQTAPAIPAPVEDDSEIPF